jgi:hypothetical protein
MEAHRPGKSRLAHFCSNCLDQTVAVYTSAVNVLDWRDPVRRRRYLSSSEKAGRSHTTINPVRKQLEPNRLSPWAASSRRLRLRRSGVGFVGDYIVPRHVHVVPGDVTTKAGARSTEEWRHWGNLLPMRNTQATYAILLHVMSNSV